MKILMLYMLVGMIVAVWTAINNQRADRGSASEERPGVGVLFPAYAMIALAWPLSLGVFLMALVSHLRSGESGN